LIRSALSSIFFRRSEVFCLSVSPLTSSI
jgi:hypothetical protein